MRIPFWVTARPVPTTAVVCLAFGLVLLSIVSPVSASSYYVSPTGNDSAAGTREAAAWPTIGRVQAHAWEPGFRPGDTGAIHVWGHRGNPGFRSGYVYNNVVYMEDAPTGVNFGIRAWDRFTGLVVANNVFYLRGERVHAVSSSRTSTADANFIGNAYYSTSGPVVIEWGAHRQAVGKYRRTW